MLIPGGHGQNAKKVATQSKFSKPCWGHFYIEAADEEADVVKFTFVCLASTEPTNVETKHNERLWFVSQDPQFAASTYEKALFYALAFGLITEDDINSGKPLDIQWAPAIGKQCILHLEKDKKDDQYTRIAYKGIYGFNSEEAIANNVPLDMAYIKSAGIVLQPRKPPAANGSAPAGGKKSTTTPKTPTGPTPPGTTNLKSPTNPSAPPVNTPVAGAPPTDLGEL